MNQVLICLENKENLNKNQLSIKQKELLALGKAIIIGNKKDIRCQVTNAFNAGTNREEILILLDYMIKKGPSLNSIIYLLKALNFEEIERKDYIDIVTDFREE